MMRVEEVDQGAYFTHSIDLFELYLRNNTPFLLDDEWEQETRGTMEYMIILPLIIIIGLVGNFVSIITIFHTRLRHIPANQYLIILTLADSVFLMGLGLITLKIDYVGYTSCVVIEYVLMSSSYVSSWAIAALTIERYLALAHPMLHLRLAHTSRTKMMLFWVPIPFVVHLLQFFYLVPGKTVLDRPCVMREGRFQLVVEVTDALLSFVLPCAIVVVLNGLVAYNMRKAHDEFGGAASVRGIRNSRKQGGRQNNGSLNILWVVPMTFVILNTPFYAMKLWDILQQYSNQSDDSQPISTWTMVLHNTTHYMYYLNFACDVIVYAFSSANFRRAAMTAWGSLLWNRRESSMGRDHTGREQTCDLLKSPMVPGQSDLTNNELTNPNELMVMSSLQEESSRSQIGDSFSLPTHL